MSTIKIFNFKYETTGIYGDLFLSSLSSRIIINMNPTKIRITWITSHIAVPIQETIYLKVYTYELVFKSLSFPVAIDLTKSPLNSGKTSPS